MKTKLMIATFLMVVTAFAQAGDAQSFAARVVGSGKQSMILIPGLGCSGQVWNATAAHFQKEFEMHILTLPGFAGQPAIEAPYIDHVRNDLIQYIRKNQLEKPVIVGHSMGAFMAMATAAEEPELVGAVIAVDGVPFLTALMDGTATPETAEPNAARMRQMMGSLTSEQFTMQTRMSLGAMIIEPKNVEMVLNESKKSDPKAVGQWVYELMTTDLRDTVSAITAPTLLMGALHAAPEQSHAMVQGAYEAQVAKIPNVEVVMAKTARHFVMLDDPGYFYEKVSSFLKAQLTNAEGVR